MSLRPRLAAVALAGVLLGACTTGSRPPPTPLEPLQAQIAGRQVWVQRVGEVGFPLVPAVLADRFLVAGDASVSALAVDDGRLLWRVDVGAPVSAGVGSDGRHSAVVTRANELVVLDGERIAWRQRLPGRVAAPPLVAGERVFVLAVDRSVHAYDALDGRLLWRQQRPGDPLTLAQAGVVAPFGDTLLVGQGARLAALDPLRGSPRWELPLATPRGTDEVQRLADLVGPVVRAGALVCARSFQQAVGCVDAARGSLAWSRPVGGTQAIGGDAQRLIGADASDRITAWRTTNGEVLWTSQRFAHRGLSGARVVGPTVVFGDREGWLHWLAVDSGQPLLRLPTDGSGVVGTPVVAGTTLLAVTRRGGVHAFRPQ
jgi:outer membrane assembly lipoprotein YfgL